MVEVVQPEGNTVIQAFTADNLLQETVEEVGPGSARTTTFGYDPVGNKTTETVTTDSTLGRSVEYRYQATGWLATETTPASSTAITYGHNLDGTMNTAIDTTGPVDVGLTLDWSTTGQQTSQATTIDGDLLAQVTGSYRPDGELAVSTTTHGSDISSTTRGYGAGASVPASASVTIPGTTSLSTAYTWTDTGQVGTLSVGATTVEDRGYRADGTVLSVATPTGTHTYTADGQARTLTHDATGLGGPSQSYGYDGAGRVTGNGSDTFGYDDNNNRTLWEAPDKRIESTYRADNSLETDTITALPALSPVQTGDYPQDAAGRRTHPFMHNVNVTPPPGTPPPVMDDCVYAYDFLNRTTGIGETSPDGCVNPDADPDDPGNYTLNLHDPLNREIAVFTTPDPTLDLTAIAAGGINPTTGTFDDIPTNADVKIDIRIYGLGERLSRTHTSDHTGGSVVTDVGFYEADSTILHHASSETGQGGTQLLGTDGQGNITTITDLAGGAVCERFYEPFGTAHTDSTCEPEDTINQTWYRGGVENTTDGTYKYGSRHYDPETGTWTTPDTARPQAPLTDLSIGTDPLTQNRYTYVNGDPVNHADPTGHCLGCGFGGFDPGEVSAALYALGVGNGGSASDEQIYDVLTSTALSHAALGASFDEATPVPTFECRRDRLGSCTDHFDIVWDQISRLNVAEILSDSFGHCRVATGDNLMCLQLAALLYGVTDAQVQADAWRALAANPGFIAAIDNLIAEGSAGEWTAPTVGMNCGGDVRGIVDYARFVTCRAPEVLAIGIVSGSRYLSGKTGRPRSTPSASAHHACSFSGETRVLMADGSTKPISRVRVGDMVLAEDPETGERGAREVTHLWVHDDTLVDLAIDGELITTTEDHPFWNHTDGEWQRADTLDESDLVLTADGELIAVDGLVAGSAQRGVAYNLTVDGIHTYYVGVGEDEVLVHNTCGMLGAGGTQVTSKTLTNRPGYRIDVENPAPGVRPGQLHLQDSRGGKYIYDFDAGRWTGLPRNIQRQIADDPAVGRAIATGRRYLGLDP